MSKKLCKGCQTTLQCTMMNFKISAKHSLKVWEQLPNCPCAICIVKAMCLDTCEDYSKFSDRMQHIMIHGVDNER